MIPSSLGAHRSRGRAGFFVLFALTLALPTGARAQGKASPSRCDRCHADAELLATRAGGTPGVDPLRLRVRSQDLAGTGHDRACAECHPAQTTTPHDAKAPVSKACAACHDAIANSWQMGVHAQARGSERAAACTACHDPHHLPAKKDLAVATNERCLGCHAESALGRSHPHGDPNKPVACSGCHGAHKIVSPRVDGAPLSRTSQAEVCAGCHAKEAGAFESDAHGRALAAGQTLPNGKTAPACTACHGAHDALRVKTLEGRRALNEKCAGCHEHSEETFVESYHGQATTVGSPNAASCSDCHGGHGVLPAKDPRSSVAPANLKDTCARCHKGSNPSFATYKAHADPNDRKGNPLLYWVYRFMTLLLIGTLGMFGLHTALWLIRLGVERVRRPSTPPAHE